MNLQELRYRYEADPNPTTAALYMRGLIRAGRFDLVNPQVSYWGVGELEQTLMLSGVNHFWEGLRLSEQIDEIFEAGETYIGNLQGERPNKTWIGEIYVARKVSESIEAGEPPNEEVVEFEQRRRHTTPRCLRVRIPLGRDRATQH